MRLTFVLCILFSSCAATPILCNGEDFEKHRYLYGQTQMPCHLFRPGTCLIVSANKADISVAQMECTYKYGGQLVIPKSREDVTEIAKRITFYPNLDPENKPLFEENDRFFLGLIGNKDYSDLRFNVKDYSNTLEETFWDSVMMSHTAERIHESEYPFADGMESRLSDEKVHQPEVGKCIEKVIALNPHTAELEVLDGTKPYRYLCETPRWPKYKCPPGYMLDRSQPMCYKVYDNGVWTWYNARLHCRNQKSVIGSARQVRVDRFSYAVFLTCKGQSLCDDGYVGCLGLSCNDDFENFSYLFVTKPSDDNLYSTNTNCQRRYDMYYYKLGVICSVRPDQSRAQVV
uniref:C-type lectin domain-containing protein n=1 Tax=Panagrellus redivivus TaxID=6233 RepID=A0A7E4V1J6_PANRE